MDFFKHLFNVTESKDCWLLFLFLLGSFLIGWLASWLLRGRRITELEDLLAGRDRDLASSRSQFTSLKEQYDLKEADLKKYLLELDNLRSRNKRLEEEKGQLYADFQAGKDENGKLRMQITTFTTQVDDLNNQILGLKTKNTQLTDDITKTVKLSDELASLQSTFGATKNRLGELEAENGKLKAEIEALNTMSTDLTKLNAELAALNADYDVAKKHISELENDKIILLTDIKTLKSAPMAMSLAPKIDETLEAKYANARNRAAEAESEVFVLRNTIEKLRTTVANAVAAAPSAPTISEEDVTALNLKYENERKRFEDLESEMLVLRTELSKLRTANEELRKPIVMKVDDLEPIEGIGPKIEDVLYRNGIRTYLQLSNTPVATLRKILDDAGPRFRLADPSTWPEQARLAANGDWQSLKEYQSKLIAGRDPNAIAVDEIVDHSGKIMLLETENSVLKHELETLKSENSVSLQTKYESARTRAQEAEAELMMLKVQMNQIKAAAQAAKMAAAPVVAQKDDLKLVEGIGPKIEQILQEKGITTFAQLANASVDTIRQILEDAGPRFRLADPATWAAQARLAHNGEWEKLKEYQEYLNGGREPDKS